MALAVVQTVAVEGSAVSSVSTAGISTTTGNLVHAFVPILHPTDSGNSSDLTGFSDTAGNFSGTSNQAITAYGLPSGSSGSATKNYAFYKPNPTGNASNAYTATLNAANYPVIVVIEISGADTFAPLDLAESTTTASTSSPSFTTSGTTATANEIVIAQASQDLAQFSFTTDSNFVEQYNNMNSNDFGGAITRCDCATRIISATGTQTFASTAGSSHPFALGVITYKAAAVGITFDAASNSGDQAASANYTFNRTVTKANPYLSVNVEMLGAGVTVTSVTDDDGGGNVPLIFIGAQSTVTSFGRVECWGLAGPISGTKSIRVILTSSIESAATAIIHGGVNQGDPTESFNSAQATNVGAADASVTITSTSDNCWIVAACVANDTSITANQTTRNNVSGTLGSGADEDNNAAVHPAGATTMSYTGIAALKTWAIAGYAIRPLADSTEAVGTIGISIAVAGTGKSTSAQPATSAINIGVAGVGASNAASVGTVGIAIAVAGVGTGSSPGQGVGSVGLNIDVAGTGISTNQQAGTIGLNIDVAGVGQTNQTVSGAGTIGIGIDVSGVPLSGIVQGGHFLPLTKKEIAEAHKRANAAREAEQAGWDRAAKERADLHKQIMATLHPEKILGVGKRETVEEDDDEADIEMLLLYG